ncbi:MAG: hypothetical protein ACREBU_23670, partial [Nitrososphaera sp.]
IHTDRSTGQTTVSPPAKPGAYLTELAMSTGSVRANVFVPIDDALVIPDGAHHIWMDMPTC